MTNDELKRKAQKWAEKKGIHEAQRVLINEGLSFSLAYQITMGTYVSDPKERVIAALKKAMAA